MKAEIKKFGTKAFPFFVILFNKKEICSTDDITKAKYLEKIITQNPYNG